MSAHTPGPWLTERNRQGGIAVVGVNDLTGINQINVANAWYESDARLIAAAPDMLEALRVAVVSLAHVAERAGSYRDAYEAVSAAIAKATQP